MIKPTSQPNLVLVIPDPPLEPAIPTVEMCRHAAASLGMPPEEGERFFLHHDQKDWMIGRNKIKKWRQALALWRLNWIKWQKRELPESRDPLKPLPIELFIRNQELEEVGRQMQAIRGSYSENLSWSDQDRIRFRELRERKEKLLKLLGRVV